MVIKTIPRESNDTTKGFTLQKLRAASLILSTISPDRPTDVLVAVEYGGDIYLNDGRIYLEENKAYASKNFTFVSDEVKNTLVYFLDYWLENNRSNSVRFGFYTTNRIGREIVAGRAKQLKIELPKEPILDLLQKEDYHAEHLLTTIKEIIVDEYHNQYKNNKQFPLETSNYKKIKAFAEIDWIDFLKTIQWKFEQEDIQALENRLIEQIKSISFPGLDINGKEQFIRALLFYELELRQTKQKEENRFIDQKDIELIYRRASVNDLVDGSFKYLNLDYTELKTNTVKYLQQFITDKYHAITSNSQLPFILERKVALFDPHIKIKNTQAESNEIIKEYSIEGLFSSFVNSEKPIFLFGELGSGKSTMIANYLQNVIQAEPDIVPIFIPSSYLQEKEFSDVEGFIGLINRYVNKEMLLTNDFFRFDILHKTKKEVLLIIDGIDELALRRSSLLLTILKRLKEGNSLLRVIVTGRPLELTGIIPSGWHNLVTLPLKEPEIKSLFFQEALNIGMSADVAETDAAERLRILNDKTELKAIANTPLVIGSIWSDLNESLRNKSLGDIVYDVLLRRLNWHEKDAKGLELKTFLEHYPNLNQREKLLADIASKIFYAPSKSITESVLFETIDFLIPDSPSKNKIAHEADSFFKSAFLQKTIGDKYGFVSAPLLESAAAIKIVEELRTQNPPARDYFLSWRSLSFAMAIARRKEVTDDIRKAVAEICINNLKWPDLNVAPVAVVAAELRDTAVANQFVEQLQKLEFRPIRLMEQKDNLTLYSLAYCFKLSDDKGFNWFYDEYLNCRTPLIHYEAKLASDILGYYFIIENFSLPAYRQQRLQSLIEPNISFGTTLCFELLPCLSVIANESLPAEKRSLLLTDLLKDNLLKTRAEAILIEIAGSNLDAVLNALETVAQKTERNETSIASELWLKLNRTRPLSKTILLNALKAVTKSNFEAVILSLSSYLAKENLFAYLRYSVLVQNEIAAQASLILFWSKEDDFDLLSNALVNSIDWLDKQYNDTDDITLFISSKKEKAADVLIRNMPLKHHMGVPPFYWKLFLQTLLESDQIYLSAFADMVMDLRPYILTRYPDIRIRLTILLNNKISYNDHLRQLANGLDRNLRYNAKSILLTCYPEAEADALINIVAGFFKVYSQNEEWQFFCLSLNYSKNVLQKLYEHLNKFIEGAKTFALLLLHHHNYPLTEAETNELMESLLGPWYYFDTVKNSYKQTNSRVLSNPVLFQKLSGFLTGSDKEKAKHAAMTLLEHHESQLSPAQKAIAWTLRIEEFESTLFDFTLIRESLQQNPSFVNSVLAYAVENRTETLLFLFLTSFDQSSIWLKIFLRFTRRAERFGRDTLYNLHHWLLSYTKRKPEVKPAVTNAIKELLMIPVYKENVYDNSLYLLILLIADDFLVSNKSEMNSLVQNRYTFPNEELLLAIALRADFIFPPHFILGGGQSHITIFQKYKPSFIAAIAIMELNRILVDSENIPDLLLPIVEQILLYGQLTTEELNNISEKNALGAYFTTLINFCRNKEADVTKLTIIRDIGTFRAYQTGKTIYHRNIIQKFYQFLFRKSGQRAAYYAHLKKELNNQETEAFHEYITELLAADEKIELQHFERLLKELLERPFYLRESLAYQLNRFFADLLPADEYPSYILLIETFLFSVLNHFEKEGSHDEFNLILWLFALAIIRLSNTVSDVARDAFLMGLQFVFLEKNDLRRSLHQPPPVFFRAGDLFHYTNDLFSKIDYSRIRQIIEYGVKSNIPEICACCRVLMALSGKDLRDIQ